MDSFAAYQAAAYSTRDRLIEFWNDTQKHFVQVLEFQEIPTY